MSDLTSVIHSKLKQEKGEEAVSKLNGIGNDDEKESKPDDDGDTNPDATSTPKDAPKSTSTPTPSRVGSQTRRLGRGHPHLQSTGGIAPSGTPRPITYDLPRTGSGANLHGDDFFTKVREAGGGRGELKQNGDRMDAGEGEGAEIDPDRVKFKRTGSDFKGGLDLDDPELREKVCLSSLSPPQHLIHHLHRN
jgi:hypothetical protein